MPLVYSLADLTPNLPPTLVGVLDEGCYKSLVEQIQKQNSNGCCLGGCFVFGCTLVLGPIGLIIGLCSCPFIWHGYSNENSQIACTNMNNIHYGGRRIFEWHDNGTLWIYPENRFDTVISVQPSAPSNVSAGQAVYVQEAYYVSPGQSGQPQTGGSAYPGAPGNVTVVQATVSPMTAQENQQQPYTPQVANTQGSYQPASGAYAPPEINSVGKTSGGSNNV